MLRRTLLAAVAVLAFQTAAQAADSEAQLVDARTLLMSMRFDAQIDQAWKQCQETTKTITPESVYQSNPSQFGGITPQSRLWPSVVNAFQQFYYDTCLYIDKEVFVNAAARSYVDALSKEDLAEAMKFFASPVGKKLADAQIAATVAFQKEAATRLGESYRQANEEFGRRLAVLIAGSKRPSD